MIENNKSQVNSSTLALFALLYCPFKYKFLTILIYLNSVFKSKSCEILCKNKVFEKLKFKQDLEYIMVFYNIIKLYFCY